MAKGSNAGSELFTDKSLFLYIKLIELRLTPRMNETERCSDAMMCICHENNASDLDEMLHAMHVVLP